MDNPVYKLEKVIISRSEDRQDFEGPLDLILYLLSKNKMEIQDIQISLICDQYLDWLRTRHELDLSVASEFVVMASQLVYLKGRMLLAIEDEETKSEVDELIASLEQRQRSERYAAIRTATAILGPMGEFGRSIVTRQQEIDSPAPVYTYDHRPDDLTRALGAIALRSERKLPPPKTAFSAIARHEPYPVQTKAAEILKRLKAIGRGAFLSFFRGNRSRSELVATFLAFLELCRANVISLGEDPDIQVTQISELPAGIFAAEGSET